MNYAVMQLVYTNRRWSFFQAQITVVVSVVFCIDSYPDHEESVFLTRPISTERQTINLTLHETNCPLKI